MKYENPNCKRVRGSHILYVSCAFCGTEIAEYQKVGRSNLVKMYNDRTVRGAVDFSKNPAAIFCPKCNEQLGARVTLKQDNKDAYRLIRGTYRSRRDY